MCIGRCDHRFANIIEGKLTHGQLAEESGEQANVKVRWWAPLEIHRGVGEGPDAAGVLIGGEGVHVPRDDRLCRAMALGPCRRVGEERERAIRMRC